MDDKYKKIVDNLLDDNHDRNTLFEGVDDIFYGRWELPPGMPDWVQKVVAMDGHDAVQTATRVMSQDRNLRIKVLPMLNDQANRDRANDMQAAFKWNLLAGLRRGESSVLWESAFSAVQYAMTATQVVYLPYQEKVLQTMGKGARLKEAKKYGDFAFVSHNPANVYPLYSMYGLEGVLIVKVQTLDEFKKEWGKLANKIAKDKDDANKYVTSYDWWDYDRRVVWGIGSATDGIARDRDLPLYEIMNEENDLGFIPFAIRRWGNSLSVNSAERYMPLLGSIWDSGQWDMLNTFASMDATLAWKRAAMPVGEHASQTGEKMRIDVSEPVTVVESGPGEKFTPLPPQTVDPRLASQYANFRGMIWQSTIARTLQSLEFPSGTAFSSINQVLSAAISSLSPYKTLTEHNIADICHLMMCWIKYYGEKYGGANLYGEYSGSKAGDVAIIPHDQLDPASVHIEITMTPDVPLDEQAMANTAVLLKRDFHIPEEELLEDIGFTDVTELGERRAQEDLNYAYVDLEIARMQRELEFEYQQKLTEMQAGIQQMQMEQAQAQAQAAQPITENAGGLGMNPAAGGTPPIQAAPGEAM